MISIIKSKKNKNKQLQNNLEAFKNSAKDTLILQKAAALLNEGF